MKLILLVCLIVLAGFGVGLSGGIPIPLSNRKNKAADIKIELVESETEESDSEESDFKL